MIKHPFTKNLPIITILWLYFSVRLAHLFTMTDLLSTEVILCGPDRIGYDVYAQGALSGAWPGNQPLDLMPLYTIFLASIYKIVGLNYVFPIIVQLLINTVACAAVYAIGCMIHKRRTGLLAALALALYGSLISFEICYAQAPLTTPLLIFMSYFLIKATRVRTGGGWLWIALAGVTLGLCALSRATMLALLPVVIGWFFIQTLRQILEFRRLNLPKPTSISAICVTPFIQKSCWRFLGQSTLFVFTLAIVISPATGHNYLVTQRFILISDAASFNFYIGNNPYSQGYGPHNLPGEYADRFGQTAFTFSSEFLEVIRRVEAGESSYAHVVVDYVSAQPFDWLELLLQKIYLMFLEADWRLIVPSENYPDSSAALKEIGWLTLLPVEWGSLMLTALVSVMFIRNRYTSLFAVIILLMSLINIIFFIKFRFRFPLIPFLLILNVMLISSSRDWLPTRRLTYITVLSLLLILYIFQTDALLLVLAYLLVSLWGQSWTLIRQYGWVWLTVISYLFVATLLLQMQVTQRSTAQTQDNFIGPDIFGPLHIGQTFVPDCNNLAHIEVALSRNSFQPDQPYYFHLVKGSDLSQEIYRTEFSVADVGRWTRKRFTFPPQPDSQGQRYTFYLHSPTSSLGNSVTVRLQVDLPTVHQRYADGSIRAGTAEVLIPFPADIAFTATCQESWQTLLRRTVQRFVG